MRKKLILAIFLFQLIVLSFNVYAQDGENMEVCYTCNTKTNAIEIHLSQFDSVLEGDRQAWKGEHVPWERSQTVKTIKGAGDVEYYMRKAGKPVKYECTLKSGNYLISFGSFWLNANLEGADGMDSWPTVKITQGKKIILPRTILGQCDTGRSELGNCAKEWAIRVFLYHSGDKPCVTVDRNLKDWVR